MSEALETSDVQLAVEAPAAPQVGASLKAAREGAGLGVAELAQMLKLGERQVLALEAGEWDKLPGNTFVRGFVRNYARLVGLDVSLLQSQLDQVLRSEAPRIDLPPSTQASLPDQHRPLRRDMAAVVAGGLLVVAAVGAYFFLPEHLWLKKPEPVALAPTAAEPVMPPPQSNGEAAAGVSGTPVQVIQPAAPEAAASVPAGTPVAPAAEVSSPTPAPASPSAATPVAAPAGGSGAMTFRFEKDSWVEVRDRDGNLLVSRLQPGGSVKEVTGTPPFSLVVGNATHVQLQYKGQAIALQPNAESDVARLTLQ